MLARRSPLKRSPLPPRRTPLRRSRKPIRQRRATPRDRGEYENRLYLAWLRTRACRVPGCPQHAEAHHLRHDEHGASLGARIKDDRRAISLCHEHHIGWLHSMPWKLLELVQCELREWQDAQLAEQRAEWEQHQAGVHADAMAF
jgi:hypothetical protein